MNVLDVQRGTYLLPMATWFATLSLLQCAMLVAGAIVLVLYVRGIFLVARRRRKMNIRLDRAAHKVVTLDFVDEQAVDGLVDHLLIADPPDRLRRIELERTASDERAASVSAAPGLRATLSRRRRLGQRELYQGRPEPSARVESVLRALVGPLSQDHIVVTNRELVIALHDAACVDERNESERFGRDVNPLAGIRDPARIARAFVAVTGEALHNASLLWLRGQFSVQSVDEELVLDGLIRADESWLDGFEFPVRTRVSADRVSTYGSRLSAGATVPLEVLGAASDLGGQPACLSVAPFAVFTRSSLLVPDVLWRLPAPLAALPQPLASIAIAMWPMKTETEHPASTPRHAARRVLRGRGASRLG